MIASIPVQYWVAITGNFDAEKAKQLSRSRENAGTFIWLGSFLVVVGAVFTIAGLTTEDRPAVIWYGPLIAGASILFKGIFRWRQTRALDSR